MHRESAGAYTWVRLRVPLCGHACARTDSSVHVRMQVCTVGGRVCTHRGERLGLVCARARV